MARTKAGSLGPKLLLMFFSLGIMFGLGELALAAFAPQRTVDRTLRDQPAMYQPSEVLFTELVPGFEGRLREREFDTAVRINSLGYRQPEFSRHKNDENDSDGEVRVLLVGDSFAFGYGVEQEESFAAVMADELVRCGVPTAKVVNAGVPGRWLDSYYLELKTRGLAMDPDLVLVSVFMGNDLASPDDDVLEWSDVDPDGLPGRLMSRESVIEEGRQVSRERKLRWRFPVVRNSHFAQLLYDSGNAIHRWVWPKVRSVDMYERSYTEDTVAALERAERLLRAMARLSNEHGARFGIVEIPAREQVYQQAHALRDELDLEKPQVVLSEILDRSGIEGIDLLPALREASDGPRLYFRYDSHFTREGYALAGRAIASEVLRRGWLPGRDPAVAAADCPR